VGAAVPADLAGRPLPKRATFRPQARPIVAEYSDPEQGPADGISKHARGFILQTANLRSSCSAEWPVYGRMRALIRYPFKLIRFADYPPEFYDLGADPEEERNLVAVHPEIAQELSAELDEIAGSEVPVSDDATLHPTISEEIREQLKALGYVGDEG
jgi:arylsulfatase A-like enzyme